MKSFMVPIGISNRHVHLTEDVYEQLFHDEIKSEFPIHQVGEYATDKFVTLKGPKGKIERVRVMGPNRSYNQVEIAMSDAYILGVNPPVVASGDLALAEDIWVCFAEKEIFLKQACILAQSHIHMSPRMAKEMGVVDKQVVHILLEKERTGILDAHVKVSDNGYFELHIDRDQANAFLLKNGDEVEGRL